MRKAHQPIFILAVMLVATTACWPVTEPEPAVTIEIEPVATVSGTEELPQPTVIATQLPPPSPTPRITPAPESQPTETTSRPIGSDLTGLSMDVPRQWIDFSSQINVPGLVNRRGINLLFAADSERTGRSLLAGKPFGSGAYVSGLWVQAPAEDDDPLAGLAAWLAADPEIAILGDVMGIDSTNGVSGAYVDVSGPPLGLSISNQEDVRARVAAFAPDPVVEGGPASWVIVVLSASADRWEETVADFDILLDSVAIRSTAPANAAVESGVRVMGELEGDRDLQTATLVRDVDDVWTFDSAGNRYTSLFLRPEEPDLDLTLTVIGPDQQTVARADNGYAGVTEAVTDLLLGQPGTYFVEAADFFRQPGRYTLSLVQSDQPQYSTGGAIEFGQVIQGNLPPQGQQYWIFDGATGQHVNVVVEPDPGTFDAILELFAPDGRRLISLDEGFSGDPEVIADLELPATGEYAILVQSFSERGGPFVLSLDENTQELSNFHDAGDLAYGDVRMETLQRQEAHAWFFQGVAGEDVVVRVAPLADNLDLDVWLLDEDVARVTAVDETALGQPEIMNQTLPRNGQYIVLVRDFNGEAGGYEIALNTLMAATPESAGALAIGDTVMGVLKPDTAASWIFNARAEDVINLKVEPDGSAADIVLGLYGPDSIKVLDMDAMPAGQGETISQFVVPVGGLWRVVIREFFGEATSYQLAIERVQ